LKYYHKYKCQHSNYCPCCIILNSGTPPDVL